MTYKYVKRITIGYAADGKQLQKRFYSNSKADLERQIFEYKKEAERVANPSAATFAEYSELWFATYKGNTSNQTQAMYANALKKCKALERYELRRITRTMCQDIINAIWSHPRTAQIVAGTLKQIFRAAVLDGIIPANPAEGLKIPKQQKKEKRLLTDEEMEAARTVQLDPDDRFFLDILMIFGLRPGEALALQERDFDFRGGVLHVTKALELSHASKVKDTKTGVCRDIPIPKAFEAKAREHFRRNPGFFIFECKDGSLLTKNAYTAKSERILRALNRQLGGNDHFNLIPDVTMYSFRHRRATDLYYLTQRGIISTKQAAALMGHSEEVFLRTYSHINPAQEDISRIYDGMAI